MIVVQGIDDLPPDPLTHDEAQMPQHAELLGDGGLLHAHLASQIAHRAWAGAQTAENAHPAGCGQGLHRLGHRAGGLSAQKRNVGVVPVTHAIIIVCTGVYGKR